MPAHAESPATAGHDNEASLGARLVLALIRAYKLVFSPHFYASCRFVPSCADYASEAVMRHGALAGGWLAMKRLARCHPLFRGGLDPVPPSKPKLTVDSSRLTDCQLSTVNCELHADSRR